MVDEKDGGNLNFLAGPRLRPFNDEDGGGKGNFLVEADRGDKAAMGATTGLLV